MTEKEINAYKKITAPSSVKERLLAESQAKSRRLSISAAFCYGVATIAAIMILTFTFFQNNTANLYFEGASIDGKETFLFQTPAIQVMRALTPSLTPVSLDIEVEEKTEISVSSGVIVIDGEDMGQAISVTDNTNFIWMLDTSTENDGYTLEVKTRKEKASFEISKKEGTDRFYIKKVN